MKKKNYIYTLLFFILLLPLRYIKANDLTQYFTVNDFNACNDSSCTVPYDEENGCKVRSKFLVKLDWSLHSPSAINDGDTVVIPFANNMYEETIQYFSCPDFSWADIYDSNNNKIGQWKIEENGINRNISIKFSNNAIGKTDISGTFTTAKNINTDYMYSDKIFPLTVGNITKNIKMITRPLSETPPTTILSNSMSSNNSAYVQAFSPRTTVIQLYDINNYPSFTNDAILNDLYYELFLPSELNASIGSLSFNGGIPLPVNLTDYKASGLSSFVTILDTFSEVTQNEGESYSNFKSRLNRFEYGIYNDNNDNKTIVINFGEQPSNELTYRYIINKKDSSIFEPGDYYNARNPITVDSNVKEIINNLLGSNNKIGGKIAYWGLGVNLIFPTVKVETTKQISGVWSWENANGEIKSESKTTNIKLVVPSSIATVSETSQLLLRDLDSKNEIIGAGIKLQKKNGSNYEDIGEAITDSSGMVSFRNLESGTYRYIQTSYLDHYINNSFKMYSDESLNNVITTFEFDSNEGNIVYATNEKEKFSVTYLPGEHGNFTNQVYDNLPYGSATPNYDAVGIDGWLFKGWSPVRDLFVMENKTYTAIWKKMVKVTTKYLEDGTNEALSNENEDVDENDTAYTTTKKDIDNYEFVRVSGNPSGTRGEEDIVVTYYYKKKEGNLNIKYLDCSTRREIASSITNRLYYGDNYDADSYELNVTIPQNYNRTAANKSENYKGIVSSDEINVEYCYNKKDSIINSELTKSGTNKITSSNDRVSYIINYNTTFTDYIGDANIIIIDSLPYKIDVSSSNLDGGVYDDENKTITWNINTNINSYNNASYNVTKNIELSYIDITASEDVISNNIVGKTIIADKNTLSETNYNTYIDIKGTINVKYVESGTNKELIDSITTTDKVGKTYELEEKTIEGYKLIDRPKNDTYEYKEGNQSLEFVYERLKYKIITKSLNEGGRITGDEEVFYGEDSTVDNIKIEAEEGYYISSITINGKDIKIPEKQNKLTMPNFTKMVEDKNIGVSFEKYSNIIKVPNTLKNSFLKFIGIIISLCTITTIFYILYKRNIIFNKGVK